MAKNQTKAVAPQQNTAGQPLPVEYDVRIYPVKNHPHILAAATVDINGAFAIRNVKVINGEKGPFVSMPQFKDGNGDYRDICFPCTKESRQKFNAAVLAAYEQKLEQSQQDAPEEQESSGPSMSQSM